MKNNEQTYQDLWDTMEAILKWKLIAMNAYIKKLERSDVLQVLRKTSISQIKNQ
jgi:hypothetical protein